MLFCLFVIYVFAIIFNNNLKMENSKNLQESDEILGPYNKKLELEIKNDNVQHIKELIENNPSYIEYFEAFSGDGINLIMCAAHYGSTNIVDYLLGFPEIYISDMWGDNAIRYAVSRNH